MEIMGDKTKTNAGSATRYCHRLLLLALCLWSTIQAAWAQQFGVEEFRPLSHDLSASVAPEYDLNGDACALLKVVCPSEFAFSTPLGIVKQEERVGEVWLYLPQGTRKLTLKHPRWGVLRDFPFPQPLSPKHTYELKVRPPMEASRLFPLDKPNGICVESRPDSFIDRQPARIEKPKMKRPWRLFGMLMAGVTEWDRPSFGLRVGLLRKHGFYLAVQSDLHSIPSTDGDCNRYGIPPGQVLAPYDTGRTREGRFSVMGGAMHPVFRNLYVHEALGYGRHTVAWEKVDGTWLRNTYYSSEGWCAEAGAAYRLHGKFLLSASVQTIAASHWEGTVGVGMVF